MSMHRILIVDDEQFNIDIIIEALSDEENYQVELAYSGDEALQILESFRPDIILLDIVMPGMDGYELCKRIRQHEKISFTKIILISGKNKVEDRLQGYQAGADDFLTKPFRMDELTAKVGVFLKLKRTEEVAEIKTSLLHLFSHESRTPLNAILGFSELIANDTDNKENTQEWAREILTQGKYLTKISERSILLLNLEREVTLQLQTEYFSVRLDLLLRAAELEGKEIEFQQELAEHLEIKTDWGLFTKVLEFLVENAIQHSPAKAKVTLRSSVQDGQVMIQISDEGPGVPEQAFEHIFDIFNGAHDIMYHKKGTGISLAICKKIMSYLQGDIRVESTPGMGATFVLCLPATLDYTL